jgi:hypothetical protein
LTPSRRGVEDLSKGRLVQLVTRDAGVTDGAGRLHDEGGGAGDVDPVVPDQRVDTPTFRAGAILVDQDREGEGMPGGPGDDAPAALAQDDEDVEAVSLELTETVAQLRDAVRADGSPGPTVELDEHRTLSRCGEIERVAGRGTAGKRRGGIANGHDATLIATVRPSRMGTRHVMKSEAA